MMTMTGVDYGRPGGDMTCSMRIERHADGSFEVVSCSYSEPPSSATLRKDFVDIQREPLADGTR